MTDKNLSNRVSSTVLVFVIGALLLLSGCSQINTNPPASVRSTPPSTSQQQAWQQRKAYFAKKANWNLNSKVSLRYDEENLIFKLNWRQLPDSSYLIQIINPITGGLISKLNKNRNKITLLADNGKTYRDNDEERLLKRQTGLNIPVKGLQHWVRGVVSPRYKVEKLVLDNAGRPKMIQQAGWTIVYTGYVNNASNALPRKINLTRATDKIYIRVIAKKWQ